MEVGIWQTRRFRGFGACQDAMLKLRRDGVLLLSVAREAPVASACGASVAPAVALLGHTPASPVLVLAFQGLPIVPKVLIFSKVGDYAPATVLYASAFPPQIALPPCVAACMF